MSVVGFDVGNETCYIAVARSGGIEVIDNEYSSRATPTYVGFNEKRRDLGTSAKQKLVPNINNTVFGFKTILGKKFQEAVKELAYLSFDIYEYPSEDLGIKLNYLKEENIFSVQQIMAMMLTKLKTVTEAKLGVKVRECVVSVPVYYTDSQRRSMLDAAEIAGLKALKLMNEPTAVALNYGFYKRHNFEEPKTVVFVDLGHSSLSVTASVFSKDRLKILGSVWNNSVGGRAFDAVLVKHFVQEFNTKYNVDVMERKKDVMLLLLECEALKKQMSMYSRELELSIFVKDTDLRGRMKRELFEELSAQIFKEIEETMMELFNRIELDVQNVDEIQVVGGSCRIPALKDIIRKVFGKEPLATLNQDEAVARGCALQCAFLSPTLKTREFHIDDIQPYSVKASCRSSSVRDETEVFPLFHTSPASKTLTYSFNEPFSFQTYYNEPSFGLPEIAKYQFYDIPPEINTSDDAQIQIQFSLDIHGILNMDSAAILMKQKESIDNSAIKQVIPLTFEAEMVVETAPEEKIQEGLSETPVDEVPRDVAKSYDLTIKASAGGLPKTDLIALIKREQEMRHHDLYEERMAAQHNVLEEYVYYARDKLMGDLKYYVSESKRNGLLSILDKTQDWLYNCDDPQENQYSEWTDLLKENLEPFLKWFSQLEDAKEAVQEFRKNMESSRLLLCDHLGDKSLDGSVADEIDEIWQHGSDFLNQCSSLLSGVVECGRLPVTAVKIRKRWNDFQVKMQGLITPESVTPEPVVEEVEETSAGGDKTDDQQQLPNKTADPPSDPDCKGGFKSADEMSAQGGQSLDEKQFCTMKID